MNIAVVGLDNQFVIDFSKILASKLNLNYISFDDEFNKVLLNNNEASLLNLNDKLTTQENWLMKKLTQQKDIILSVSNDTFVSNENYKLFQNFVTIFIEKKETDKILKNIQKLIKKHCKITIKQEKIDINKILNIIKG